MSDAINITGLAQIAFSVRDLDRAVVFYRDVLGLPFLFNAPPQMAFLQCGPTRLMLSAQPGGDAESHPILYYAVTNIHTAFEELARKGAPVKQPPHVIARLGANDLWLAFTEDPDGHPVGLMSEVPAVTT